jgi:hypothetical protein
MEEGKMGEACNIHRRGKKLHTAFPMENLK